MGDLNFGNIHNGDQDASVIFYIKMAILICNFQDGDQDASVVLKWSGDLDFSYHDGDISPANGDISANKDD